MPPWAILLAVAATIVTLTILNALACKQRRQADARWTAETRAQEGRGGKSKTSVHRDRGVSRGH